MSLARHGSEGKKKNPTKDDKTNKKVGTDKVEPSNLLYVFTWFTCVISAIFLFTVNSKKYGHGKQELKKSISKEGRSMYKLILFMLISYTHPESFRIDCFCVDMRDVCGN